MTAVVGGVVFGRKFFCLKCCVLCSYCNKGVLRVGCFSVYANARCDV